nr:TMEM175 family protein [Rhodoferax sp.]
MDSGKGRLEAFSDGVMAIIIMVLELKVPMDSALAHAVGGDFKGKVSLASYVLALPLALSGYAWFAGALLIAMALALMWFIPDLRIEKELHQ